MSHLAEQLRRAISAAEKATDQKNKSILAKRAYFLACELEKKILCHDTETVSGKHS
jgi:hypothetical protein